MSTRRSLVARRRHLINEVCERKNLDEEYDCSDQLQIIDDYEKLIDHATPSHYRALLAGAIALLCISIVGIASSWQVTNNKVIIRLETDAVQLRLSSTWEWHGLALQNALRLEQMSKVDAPDTGVESTKKMTLTGRPWMELNNGQIAISELSIKQKAVLKLHRTEGNIYTMYVQGASMYGRIDVSGDALEIRAGQAQARPQILFSGDRPLSQLLYFGSEGRDIAPAIIRMQPAEQLALDNIIVNKLSFTTQVPAGPAETEFDCMIHSGTIRIKGIDQITSFEKGDCLSTENVDGRVVEISIGETIGFTFEGTVERISIGPKGFQKDITPTYLEWLYQNKRLSFLWGAVVFAWGMLWSTRRLFTN